MTSVLPPLAAVSSLVGIYLFGVRIFGGVRWAVTAAAFLAFTPLLWELIQSAPASLYPVVFVIGWLVAVAYWLETLEPWWAAVAGGLLGAGLYASRAGVVMMPVYLLLTIVVVRHAGKASAWFPVAFLAVAAPLALSLLWHPDDFRNAVNAYHLYDASRFNIWQGLREMSSWIGLTARSEVYWDYFNPAFLFSGRVFFWPLTLLVPAGLWRIATRGASPLDLLMIGGFLAAPFAAALTAQPPTPRRIVLLTPFAAIVATYGVQQILSWSNSLLDRTWSARVERLEA